MCFNVKSSKSAQSFPINLKVVTRLNAKESDNCFHHLGLTFIRCAYFVPSLLHV